MGDSKRWSVTYTKHVKQKRKLYQDGFLQLQISTNKVTLYDECDKLLACKLLKDDGTVTSGETLEFNGYLVDIGDPEGEVCIKTEPDLKVDTKRKTGSTFKTPTVDTKISAAKGNIVPRIRKPLSPSQQIIKEFKKRELLKYGSPPQVSPETTKPSTTEWQVLYTTQVTQKAKKYHDGFIQVIHGSRGGQVMLFDASRKLLDSRFLKKDDVIRPGESIRFDAHLVDTGELQPNHKPDCIVQGENCNDVEIVEKNQKMERQHTSLDTDANVPVGKSEWQVLYTTQLTQKAKKYHDGFLQLELCGSRGRQVVLFDSSKIPLERRFLKKDEVVRAGEALRFDGHLVDVGEPEGSHQPPMKLNEQGIGNAVVERRILRHRQNGSLKANRYVSKGQLPSKPCIGQDAGLNSLSPEIEEIEPVPKKGEIESNGMVPSIKPLRDASQILSILQYPVPQERCTIGGRSPNGSCHNVVDSKSSETLKSLDNKFSKAARVGGGFQLTGNAEMSQQPCPDKEAGTNMSEADVGLSISSLGDLSSCVITNEGKSAEEFSRKTETLPSFDLGF